ncbi:hypothetical protein ScPMuIL_000838 [Solemya velum]
MRQLFLHDQQVSTPENLRRSLEDPYLRQRYIVDASIQSVTMKEICESTPQLDEHGNYLLSPVGGKRRIDYIMFNKSYPVTMKNYNFVTRLASLTDHIPVSVTVSLPNASQ